MYVGRWFTEISKWGPEFRYLFRRISLAIHFSSGLIPSVGLNLPLVDKAWHGALGNRTAICRIIAPLFAEYPEHPERCVLWCSLCGVVSVPSLLRATRHTVVTIPTVRSDAARIASEIAIALVESDELSIYRRFLQLADNLAAESGATIYQPCGWRPCSQSECDPCDPRGASEENKAEPSRPTMSLVLSWGVPVYPFGGLANNEIKRKIWLLGNPP